MFFMYTWEYVEFLVSLNLTKNRLVNALISTRIETNLFPKIPTLPKMENKKKEI